MREVRRIDEYDYNRARLLRLVPTYDFNDRPCTDIDNGRAFFSSEANIDKETLCWCIPRNLTPEMVDYFAIPLKDIDAVNAMHILNRYWFLPPTPEHRDGREACYQVLDDLAKIRPDKILCAEVKVAKKKVLTALTEEHGYDLGHSVLNPGMVVYLGTYRSERNNMLGSTANGQAVYIATGQNASVIVEGLSDNYIGPIWIGREISRPDAKNTTFKGFAIKYVNGRLRDNLKNDYRQKDRRDDTRLDALVKSMLFAKTI